VRLPHHPEVVQGLRVPTVDDPWRVLISGCLMGWRTLTDGTDYGRGRPRWFASPRVEAVPFCPEDYRLGTPRTMPDLHGGDGFDVLDGTARVLDENREDLTERVLAGAIAMVELARERDIDFALMVDRSGTCGSQVISVGCRLEEPVDHRKGVGVAAAALLRAGFHVVSQRDFRTLELLHAKVEAEYRIDPAAVDHHNHPWVLENLP